MSALSVAYQETPEEVSAEDQARAGIYGVIAHLFCAPPGADLLTVIAQAQVVEPGADADPAFAAAWSQLQRAAREADADAVRQEYDDAFITAGRAPVFLYGSYYETGFLMEKPLAGLREELAQLGLARKPQIGETEDHISALCDVMRFLIAGDGETAPASIDSQRAFFGRHLAPWYGKLCAAIEDAEVTRFYKAAAAFARSFFDLEKHSFEMA